MKRISEKYSIPASRLDFTPQELEYEIAVLLADVIVNEAQEINRLPVREWPEAFMKLKRSDDWLDKLIAEKVMQTRGK